MLILSNVFIFKSFRFTLSPGQTNKLVATRTGSLTNQKKNTTQPKYFVKKITQENKCLENLLKTMNATSFKSGFEVQNLWKYSNILINSSLGSLYTTRQNEASSRIFR